MNDTGTDLVFRNDEGVYLRLVQDITLYWRGSITGHREGLLDFYRTALSVVGAELRFFRTESMTRSRPLKPETLELLPNWLGKSKAKRGIYMLSLEGGTDRDEPSEHGFYFLADEEEETKAGLIRLILPPTSMEQGWPKMRPLVLELASRLDFDSGHAGFAVNWDPEGESENEATRAMTMIAKKYPGVDLTYVDSTIIALQKSARPAIKCANWLTFVGKDIAARLPPGEDLREAVRPDCTLHPVGTGLVFQAGSRPALGYPDRTPMRPYAKVGELLRDFRLRDHPQILEGPALHATEDWLSRFD